MKITTVLSLICATGLMAGGPLMARDKHAKGGKGDSEEAGRGRDERQNVIMDDHRRFSDEEREKIYGFCERYGKQEGKHPRSLPPGLAKKVARGGKLPPGWQERCAPGQIMPVEVYHECRPLPPELTVKLPVPPVGTITVAIGGRVVRLLEATREILDVFNVHVQF